MPMQPTLKQLEALYWTGQLGSFQAAATQLHTSQSAVAKRVGELHDIFGKSLVDPGNRRARLTEYGQRLMVCAEEVLLARQKLMNSMSQPSDFSGVLRLGVSELVAVTWLPLLIERLKVLHPHAVVDLDVAPGGLLLTKLKAAELHLVFSAGPMWDSSFDSVELDEIEFSWMASPKLNVPDHVLTPDEISAFPMLMHSPNGLVSQLISQWQRRSGFSMHRVFTANSLTVMVQMTIAGLGISSLPAAYMAHHLTDGRLVQVRTSPALPNQRYFAVYRNVEHFPFISDVIEVAKSVCDFGRGSTIESSKT